MKSILPRATGFFDFFEQHVERTIEGARLFQELLENLDNPVYRVTNRIKEVEHQADVLTHQTVEMLHTTFITPFDRHDIHRLISRMDDVMDAIDNAAERLLLYDIKVATPSSKELARLLRQASEQLRIAVQGMRDIKQAQHKIKAACVDINRLENEADAIIRLAVAALFREEKDPLVVIKWKEIYESLEFAADRCEDVANIIEGVVLENA